MVFVFFSVESIRGFTSNFVAMCPATSQPFVFPSRIKHPPLGILKFLVATLRDQDKKFSSIQVDKYRALAISSEFMKTCNNMDIIVQTKSRDTSSINGESESTNKTLSNITRSLLLKSNHKKELL